MSTHSSRHSRPLSYTTLLSRDEQEKEAALRNAARLGRVAYHQGSKVDAYPYPEGDDLRPLWLNGLEEAAKRHNRPDMSPARATGFRAFKDGLTLYEKNPPFKIITKEAGEWAEGWYQAEAANKRDQEKYR